MLYSAAEIEQFLLPKMSLYFQPFSRCQIWSIKYHWSFTLCFFPLLFPKFQTGLIYCFGFVFILQNRSRYSSLTYSWLKFKNKLVIQFWMFQNWAQWSLLRAWSNIIFHDSLLMLLLPFFLQFQASLFQYFIVIVHQANEFHLILRQLRW